MKSLMTAFLLGALVTAPVFAPAAYAQRPSGSASERARIIQECMALNKREPHDPYSATGGVQHHYRACMGNHGQPE